VGLGVGPAAVLACLPGEQHDLGLIAFGLALRALAARHRLAIGGAAAVRELDGALTLDGDVIAAAMRIAESVAA
jgi:hypothetical protein